MGERDRDNETGREEYREGNVSEREWKKGKEKKRDMKWEGKRWKEGGREEGQEREWHN